MPDHVVAFPEKLLKTITQFLAYNSPKTVSLSTPPDPLATMGPTSKGRGWGGREGGERGEGRRKG